MDLAIVDAREQAVELLDQVGIGGMAARIGRALLEGGVERSLRILAPGEDDLVGRGHAVEDQGARGGGK